MRRPTSQTSLINAAKGHREKTIYTPLSKFINARSKLSVLEPKTDVDPSLTQRIINDVTWKVAYSFYGDRLNNNTAERAARYMDFDMMEFEPIIASALDIYADESTMLNESGKLIEISSQSNKVKDILRDFLDNILEVDTNAWTWIRNMCKYGDLFVFTETQEKEGVTRCLPMPSIEIEKEIGWDEGKPDKVRYKWLLMNSPTRANSKGIIAGLGGKTYIDDVNMTHFSIDMDDRFFPYGRSVLDPARRIWKQLMMLEDAMLIYRVTRSPERRVFQIEVGNLNPKDIPDYLQRVKDQLKKSPVISNTSNGLMQLKYNPLSVDEDYFVPSRGGVASKIETLPGAQNLGDIEDVEYMQRKLFSVLKVPKAYLTYEGDVQAKSLLSQEDVRFSRSIERIQRLFLSGLKRLCILHLFLKKVPVEDILAFELKMTNPSHQAELMQLEIWERRMAVFQAATGVTKCMSPETAMKVFLGYTDGEVKRELKRIQTNPHDELQSADAGGGMGGEFGDEAWDQASPPTYASETGGGAEGFGVPSEPTQEPMALESVQREQTVGTSNKSIFKEIQDLLTGKEEKKND